MKITKKNVIPMRMKNRLYTSWVSPTGMDCKLIGPETLCFCQHRYKQHKTDFKEIPTERPILLPCRVDKCGCSSYHYVPFNGSQPIRCHCKHPADEHSEVAPFKCKRSSCGKCFGFCSSFTCGCGQTVHDHHMVVETAKEREDRGHPVGQPTPYAAMGGITGFSSLAEGYLRLDPSGAGAPSKEFLSQPILSSDHAFLRSNLQTMVTASLSHNSQGLSDEEKMELESSLRKPEETELEYFERRYKERQGKLYVVPKPLGYLDTKSRSDTASTSADAFQCEGKMKK